MKPFKFSDYCILEPKQQEAYNHIGRGKKIFFGGARGGGKSHLSLAAAVAASLQYENLTTIIIRETAPELREVFIDNLEKFYPPHIFGYRLKVSVNVAYFENGSKIVFKPCDSPRAAKKIQGAQYQFMIIDEANNFDELTLHKLFGSVRRDDQCAFIPTVLMTGNPGGISDLYFRTRFITPDYSRWKPEELEGKDDYVFVKSMVSDNPHVGKEYKRMLEQLPDNLKRAWLYGEWNVFEGQFFEQWNESVHVVKAFEPPADWRRICGFDLGYTSKHPAVCLWGAQDPKTLTVYIYREYVMAGSTMQYIADIAEYFVDETVDAMYCDPSMWSEGKKDNYEDESTAFMFLREGLPVLPANNKRINGWRVLKQWLHWTQRKKPKLLIMDCCPNLILKLPMNRYSTDTRVVFEDLDTRGPDDEVDALRYMMVSGFGYPTSTYVTPEGEIKQEEDSAETADMMEAYMTTSYREAWKYRSRIKESYKRHVKQYTKAYY